jgi:nicotinamide phosphoribosyltransferase
MQIQPTLQTDFYKVNHAPMYPENTVNIVDNLTPRKSRMAGIKDVVVFGIQYFILEFLIKQWNENFFKAHRMEHIGGNQYKKVYLSKEEAIAPFKRVMDYTLGVGAVSTKWLEKLWDLGFMPLHIKSLPEGTLCPIGVPAYTVKVSEAYADIPLSAGGYAWIPNYLETIMSCAVWQPMTSATLGYEFRKILDKWAITTTGSTEGVQWQGHDFSMRGMSSLESACTSGSGHLLSFTGTDTVPAISFLEQYYYANVEKELIGASIPATEHSVMCMGTKDDEIGTIERLLNLYPQGILSIVSDTWDLWKVLTYHLPKLKRKIMMHGKWEATEKTPFWNKSDTFSHVIKYSPDYESIVEEYFLNDTTGTRFTCEEIENHAGIQHTPGKLVIRPDSGDPADIICGHKEFTIVDGKYYTLDNRFMADNLIADKDIPACKGVIQLLYEVFGGTKNDRGFIVLDPHVGAIYGDSINIERAEDICQRLSYKVFASLNIVFGIGSYTYQFVTRDTFGFAIKATYGELKQQRTTYTSDGLDYKEDYIEAREIFKDPITDDGTKKSLKGLLMVYNSPAGIKVKDQCTKEEEQQGLLETVFLNGVATNQQSLVDIRARLKKQ